MDEARWIALGIYDPADPGASDRLGLIRFLVERGATDDQMVQAHQTFGLAGLISELVRSWPEPSISVAQAAEATGLDATGIRRLWLAQGLTLPADDDAPCFRASDVRFLEIGAAGAALFGIDVTLSFTRALANGIIHIGEAAQDAFNSAVADRYAARSELEYAQSAEAALGLEALIIEALALAYPIHAEERTARFRRTRGEVKRGASAMRRTVGFIDLVGSTELAASSSLSDYSDALDRFEAMAFELASERKARIVKMIGDEVMFVAGEAELAAQYAADVSTRAATIQGVSGARAGIATGEVLGRGGDVFGAVVNLAARATSVADPEQIVVAVETAVELRRSSAWRVTSLGLHPLRGFPDHVELHLAVRQEDGDPGSGSTDH